MPAPQVLSARPWRTLLILLVLLGWQTMTAPFAAAQNPTDSSINQRVWQLLYGVAADSSLDINGMIHSDEATAGIAPGKGIRFQVSTFSTSGGNAQLTFQSVIGKYYNVQARASLLTGTWSPAISGVTFVGDGTIHTLTVTPAQNPGPYFRVDVQDNSTANDDVSDWAKAVLGYAAGTPIGSQSSYDHTALANALAAQNVVTVVATAASTTQPPDGVTAPATLGAITFNRSGYQLFSTITVPIAVSVGAGYAIPGTDYVALPGSVTFPAGVNTVTLNVTPLYNPNRNSATNQANTNSTIVTVTAGPGGGYTVGSPSSASVTIYPATQGGQATGTGLTGQFWVGSNAAYTNAVGLGLAAATYVFTPITGSTTSGTIVVTYSGKPAVPFAVGQSLNLSFTSGLLTGDSTEWNTSYTTATTPPTWQYTITAIGTNTFTVPITTNGAALPAATSGNVNVAPFAARSNASNFGGLAVTYTYSTSTHIATISYTGTPSVAFTNGGTATLQFTSGGLYTTAAQNGPGVYDGTYTTSSVTFNSGGSGSGTFTVPIVLGSFVPSSTGGNATLTPFTAPVLLANNGNASSRIDPTVDFIFGTGQPANTSLQTGTNQNWAARWDTYLVPPTTGNYTFQVTAFDGARVYVNGNLVIDAWVAGSSSFTPATSAAIALTAGTIYPVRVEYYHLDGASASINLQWEKPGDSSYSGVPDIYTFLSSTGTGLLGWTGLYWTNMGGTVVSPSTISGTSIISIGSPAVVNWTSHGLIAGSPVVFSTTGSLPTGLTAGATYYVLPTGLTANSFEISTTPAGSFYGGSTVAAPVVTSGTQSGTQTAQAFTALFNEPHYSDFPSSLSNLSWPSSSQPTAQVASASNFSIRWDGYLVAGVASATNLISAANPAVVTWFQNGVSSPHGLSAGTPVVFSTTGALPGTLTAGLTAGTTYYVLTAGLTANTFEVSTTPGGTAVSTSGLSQSGTQTVSVAPGNSVTYSYNFNVQASDGARVYLDTTGAGITNSKIIDAWTADSSATTPIATGSPITLNAGQPYRFRVEYFQSENNTVTNNGFINLQWQQGAGSFANIPGANLFRMDPLTGVATDITGLFAAFYNNTTLTDPALYAAQDINSPTFNGSNSATSVTSYSFLTSKPSSGNLGTASNNNWSGKFTTFLKATSGAGNYQFQLLAQTAGQLIVDGAVAIPFTAGNSPASSALNWTANSYHSVEVDFYDSTANGEAILSWNFNGGTFAIVPTTSFFLDGSGTTQTQGNVTGAYFSNTAFLGDAYFSDYQTQINYNKTTGAPGDTWVGHAFSATWDGYLAAATAGTYTFSLQAQSKARVYVNGTLVCDGWTTPGSSATTPVVGTISLPGGANARVPFHVDYENSTTGAYIYLLWQSPAATSLGTMPNTAFYRDASTAQTGLLATYYANSTQTPPYFYQVAENNSAEIDYFFGTGTPDPNMAGSNFTALWTGQVLPQYTEPYYFTVKSDDGCRLFVNGQLVIDKWQSQGTTEWMSAPISLNAGDYYDIRLEYLNISGNAEVHLNWYSADQGEQIIPQTRLFPTSTGVANNSGPSGVTSTTNDVYIAGSGTPYTYTITGTGSPSTYSASGLPAGLTLAGNVISGTPSTPGNYQFTVTTTNAAGTSSVVVNLQVASAVGNITREYYAPGAAATGGVAGPSVTDLQIAIAYAVANNITPPADTLLTSLESTTANYGSNFPTNAGERLRGYFTAPATGNYYFWVAASGGAVDANHNIAELWISDSNQAVAKILRATLAGTSGTTLRTWNAQSNQQSPWLSLIGGQQYDFEVLHNVGSTGSNSNVSVGWFLDPTGNSANVGSSVNSPVAISIAAPAVVTWSSHGLAPGSPVVFSTTGALPTGLTAGTTYYVLGTAMTGNSFEVSTTINGTAVNTTGSQSGTQTATSTRANPIANGSGPAAASSGGLVPSYVLSPWNNPPTTTTPSTIYLATLAGSSKLSNIKGSGGAYVALNGSTGILHVSYSGLTSGETAVQIYSGGTLLFDAGAQDKNYPTLKTTDGGYTWSGITGSVLTALQNGTAFVAIATANNPITVNNPYGELTGFFGAASGSQVAPALPSYSSPSWTDDKSTLTAARFLTQATFGPSPSDMNYITTNGCRAWLENQLGITPTYTVPNVLNHLSADPQNPYNDPLFFNAWWQNAVTAPDQLRQRVAFAFSEIMVASDVGPLNNNDRPLADYYDNIVQYCLGTGSNFRTLLKQVTLTNAMGQYLNMQGNYKGSLITGLHANENYGREIMQLFSVGLYLRWNDGTLVLDSTGNPIPTYNQSVITGMSHALTGWNYGQPLIAGSGPNAFRLPTGGPSTNYLDPMVLISNQHELGTKLLLDNVVLPAAIVLSQSDISHDPAPPSRQITVETTDPVLGPGNTVFTAITSTYDLYALQDFESALNNIVNNPSVAPYICRQLIQRLVTSSPQPAYVYRVVRAFRGERNIDGVSTGVVGDLDDTIRAILLDPEARSTAEAAAPGTASPPTLGFGKQREPLLRVTGPARAFPVTGLTAVPYRQLGGQLLMIGPTSVAHRLSNSDTVFLDSFAGAGDLPYSVGYSVGNTTPSYSYVGTTKVATINAPGYKAGDNINIQFTTGTLGTTSPYNTVQSYPVVSATTGNSTSGSFTVNITGAGAPAGNTSGNAFTPNNFTVTSGGYTTPAYTATGSTATVSLGNLSVGEEIYVEFTTGGLLSTGNDGIYSVLANPAPTSSNCAITLPSPPGSAIASIATGSPCTITTSTPHKQAVGTTFTVAISGVVGGTFSSPSTINGSFTATSTGTSTFTVVDNCTVSPTPGTGIITYSGNTLIPNFSGGYTVTTSGNNATITLQTTGNFDLNVGDQLWVHYPVVLSPFGAVDGLYDVVSAPGGNLLGVSRHGVGNGNLTAGTESTSGPGYVGYPLVIHAATRSGTCHVDFGTWNINNTNSSLDQSPVNSTTVFNFFYPTFQYPGAIAQAGMTTPEFQLTDATDTMNLTNTVTSGILNAGNAYGFTSFFSGAGGIVLDLWQPQGDPVFGQYLTFARTQDSAIPALVDTLGLLLTAGRLDHTTANGTIIANYVANQTNFPLTATATTQQMANRVRAIIQLILISPEYAIQK